MSQGYLRWKESHWCSASIPWQAGKFITAGIDVGSVSTQAVVLVDGILYAYANMRTGSRSVDSAHQAVNWALRDTDLTLDKIRYVVATGCGRLNVSFAHKRVTETACHARGASLLCGPSVRTVLDLGGQTWKLIRFDANGKIASFLLNDESTAGAGRGLQVLADLMRVPIAEMGKLSLQVEKDPEPASSAGGVLAQTEALALLRKGLTRNQVLAAYCGAVAKGICELLGRTNVEKDLAITGGIAKNVGVISRVEKELGFSAVKPQFDPQIAGAVGAAAIAKSELEAERGRKQADAAFS